MEWLKNYNQLKTEAMQYALEHMQVLELLGKDAANVMQGQSTSDVLNLVSNQIQMSAY